MEEKNTLKSSIIGRLLIIALGGFYRNFFINNDWIEYPLWLTIVFCVLPYVILYFHRVWIRGIIALIVVSIGLWIYKGQDMFLGLGLLSVIAGFYQTAHTIYEDVHNKIKVSSFDVFTGESVGKFVTYMTLGYIFTFISYHQSFTLSCESVYFYSNKIMAFVVGQEDHNIKSTLGKRTSTFISSSINNTVKGTIGLFEKITQDPKLATIIVPQGYTGSIQFSGISSEVIQGLLNKYGGNVVQQTFNQSDRIEQGVCDIIIQDVKQKYESGNFKLSVIVMMYLMIRPAMEFVLHLVSYINWLIFSIMFKLKRFRKYEDWEVSENIE